MRAIITILGTLLISLTASADTNSKSCIEILSGKTVSFNFSDSKFWNMVRGPYTVKLNFDASIRGGMVTYSTDYGFNADLKIYPVAKLLVHELATKRVDQEVGEHQVQLLDCYGEKHKKSCESSVKEFFKELVNAQAASLVDSDEIDQAISCAIQSLKQTVL